MGPYWEKTKDVVLRPGTLGGLMGVGESTKDSYPTAVAEPQSTLEFSVRSDTLPTLDEINHGTEELSAVLSRVLLLFSVPRGRWWISRLCIGSLTPQIPRGILPLHARGTRGGRASEARGIQGLPASQGGHSPTGRCWRSCWFLCVALMVLGSSADDAVNLAVLGTVGYFSYKNWNHPWDRRVVSAVAVGLLGLSGLEG